MTDAKSSGAVLESVLEAVFRESDPGGNVPGEGPSWATILQHLFWPSGAAQLQALLTAAVAQVLTQSCPMLPNFRRPPKFGGFQKIVQNIL